MVKSNYWKYSKKIERIWTLPLFPLKVKALQVQRLCFMLPVLLGLCP